MPVASPKTTVCGPTLPAWHRAIPLPLLIKNTYILRNHHDFFLHSLNSPAAASEALQDKHFAYLQGVPTHQLERLVKTAVSGVETAGVETAGVDTTFVLHAPQEDFTNADDDTIEVCGQVHLNPTALCWSYPYVTPRVSPRVRLLFG